MKISEVCARTGLTDRAIRFYIEKGLLQTPAENINGRNCREYEEEDVRQLNRISALRKIGFSIQDILEMQQGTEAVRVVMENHSKKMEEEADKFVSIAKELKSIHLGGGVSWKTLADVLKADAEQHFSGIEFRWPQEADMVWENEKEKIWKRRKNRIKNGLAIGMLCLGLSVVLVGLVYTWKKEKEQSKRVITTTSLSEVCFQEIWRTDNEMYASIYSAGHPGSLSAYFYEPVVVKLGTGVDTQAIATEEGIYYMTVLICLDIPYGVAEVFDVTYVDEATGITCLDMYKALKYKNLVENYCTVMSVSYDNDISDRGY